MSFATSTEDPVPLRVEIHRDGKRVLARDYLVAPGDEGTTPGATRYSELFTLEPGAYRLLARSDQLTAVHDDRLDGSTKGYVIHVHPDRIVVTSIG